MVDGLRPFVSRPVALVATAEKGYQSVRVDLASDGGHSSMPAIDGSTSEALLRPASPPRRTRRPAPSRSHAAWQPAARSVARSLRSSQPLPLTRAIVGDMLGRLLSKLSGAPPAPKLVPPVTDMLRGAAPYAPGACPEPRGLGRVLQAVRILRAQLQGGSTGVVLSPPACMCTHERCNRCCSPCAHAMPHLLPAPAAWLSVIIRTMGVLPGGDLLLARIMAAASGEAAALVRGAARRGARAPPCCTAPMIGAHGS